MKEEIPGAVEDRAATHIASAAGVVNTCDRGAKGLTHHVAGADKQRHVFLKVLVGAWQHSGDGVDVNGDRELARLVYNRLHSPHEALHVLLIHEVDGLPDQVEGHLLNSDAGGPLPSSNAELHIADALRRNVNDGSVAGDLPAPPIRLA